MVEEFLDEQFAHVGREFEAEPGVLLEQFGDDDLVEHAVGGRAEVEAADAGQVGLDKAEGVLPHGAGEVHHGVEAAEHRVVLALRRSPAIPEPLLLPRREAEQFAHGEVLLVNVRQALEGVEDGERDGMDVGQLVRADGDGAGEDADGLGDALVLVDKVLGLGLLLDGLDEVAQALRGEAGEGALHAPGEAQTGKARFFRWGEHETSGYHAGPDDERARGVWRVDPDRTRAERAVVLRGPAGMG
jgi:hypothetical protein